MSDQPATTTAALAAITESAIDEALIRRAVETPSSGAIVVFAGIVRNHDGGRGVVSLDYQAHPEAQAILRECCATITAETGLAAAAAHRIGHLEIGDTALFAAVAAAHRREAFDACALLVERIKSTVPIWKRQHFSDGASEWVGL